MTTPGREPLTDAQVIQRLTVLRDRAEVLAAVAEAEDKRTLIQEFQWDVEALDLAIGVCRAVADRRAVES